MLAVPCAGQGAHQFAIFTRAAVALGRRQKVPASGKVFGLPDHIAQNVPKLKGVLMLKELLEEVMSNADNRKDFRNLLGKLLGDEEALGKMMEELKGFEGFQLPSAT